LEQNYDVYQDSYCNDVTVEDALLEKKNWVFGTIEANRDSQGR
jgi:hypothetical protein